MQTPTNVFIVNLALSDVLMCLFAVPLTPLHAFMDEWIFGEIICKLFPTTQVREAIYWEDKKRLFHVSCAAICAMCCGS